MEPAEGSDEHGFIGWVLARGRFWCRKSLTTGIGEAPMPSQCHRCRRQPPQVPQFNLFGDQDLGPLWRQLPPAIRLAVTKLMYGSVSDRAIEVGRVERHYR